MSASRSIRTLSVLASAALVLTSMIAGTADAKKKKKPKVPPPPPACATFTPGELGTGADTSIVTQAATADAPLEVKLATDPGVGVGTGIAQADAVLTSEISHAIQNVQVDVPTSATLFIRLEMPATTDYDLYVYSREGEVVAQAAGFNPEPAIYNDDSHGGHTEKGAEMIDGLSMGDCEGYTLDIAGATTQGGEVTLKFWVE